MQLIHGDCLEKMKDIPDKSIDMILCDLPYGATNNTWDSTIQTTTLFTIYNRIIKYNKPIILFGQNPYTSELIYLNKNMYSHSYVWIKNNSTGYQRVSSQPLRVYEDIIVFYPNKDINSRFTDDLFLPVKKYIIDMFNRTGMTLKEFNKLCGFEASGYLRKSSSWANVVPTGDKLQKLIEVLHIDNDYYRQLLPVCEKTYNLHTTNECDKITKRSGSGSNWQRMRSDIYKQTKTNYPVNILFFKKDTHSVHPTQKPVALLEYLIKTYTLEGETVLDNTMGSGSTGVACVNTGRNFIGIEKDDKYFEIAKKRIEEHLTTAST